MSRLAVILIFVVAGTAIKAQSEELTKDVPSSDTLGAPSSLPDSVGLKQRQQLDSIQSSVSSSFDSLKGEYDHINSTADKAISKYQKGIDSLQQLNLPAGKLTAKRDSITNWRNEKLAPIKAKSDSLRAKTIGKINSMELPPELSEHTQQLTSKIDKFDVTLPSEKLPDLSLNNSSTLPDISNPLGEQTLPALPGADGKLPQGLSDLGEKAKIPEVSKLGEAGEQAQKISDVVPKNADEVSAAAEQHVTKIDAVSGVSEQVGQADQYKETLMQKQDPAALKQQTMNQAKEAAIDHFAGKEQQLQEAMQKVAKYKQKYSSVQSLSELPKKKPNEMKGKPFIERIVPGVALQIHRRNEWLVDFNPYAGYRLSGRLTTGAGWNQRIAYNTDSRSFASAYKIYGPRIFGEFKVIKGFSGRLELEYMNSYVPPAIAAPVTDPEQRRWIFSTMAGMKKEYRFIKNVKGTVFILYNLYDPGHRSPYGDRLIMRFGFEFPMKKKQKKEKAAQGEK